MSVFVYVWPLGVVLGLQLIVLGPICAFHVWRATARLRHLRWPVRLLLIIAAVAGFGIGPTLYYTVNETTRVIGVPFFAMIWAKEGNYWTDFVGPFTALASLGNAVVGALVPFIVSSAVVVFRGVRLPPKMSDSPAGS